MRLRVALAGAAGALAVITAISPPAQAAPPGQAITHCGQTIPNGASYLTRNLNCSTGFRILPGSGDSPEDPVGRNVTIDLRGHRLKGSGTGTAFDAYTYPGFSNLEVRNGRIEDWARGILVYGFASVTEVKLLNNGTALACEGCRATNSLIKNNDIGISVYEDTVQVTKTAIIGNRIGSETYGQLSGGTYTDSIFTDNQIALRYGGLMSSVTARKNVFTRNGVGIRGEDAGEDNDYQQTRITANAFIRNGDGIYLTVRGPEGSAYIARNIALKNKRYGIYAPGATDGAENKAVGNGQPCVGVACSKP